MEREGEGEIGLMNHNILITGMPVSGEQRDQTDEKEGTEKKIPDERTRGKRPGIDQRKNREKIRKAAHIKTTREAGINDKTGAPAGRPIRSPQDVKTGM